MLTPKSGLCVIGFSLICLSAHVNCGKMADWIRMLFGMVSGVGPGMGVLDFGGDRRRKGAVWE